MATADEYAQWIVSNADKKGTPEFQTVAAAYQEASQAETSKPKQSIYEQQAQEQSKSPFGVDNFLPAVGGAMNSAYLGGKQMLMKGLDTVSPRQQTLSDLVIGRKPVSRADEMIPQIEENRAAMQGLTSTNMGMAGDVVGNVAMALPTMLNPALATVRGSALVGGGVGALRPTLGDESRLENTASGAALSAGGSWLGNKIIGSLVGQRGAQTATGGSATASSTGGSASASSTVSGGATARGSGGGYNFGNVGDDVSAGLTSSQKRLVARNPDFKLTPGQASGSRSLQQLEAKLESQPMTSGTFNTIKAENQALINRRVAESIGERSNVVDSDVLARAHERIGRVYNIVADQTPRKINTDTFLNRLGGVESNFEGMLFANGKPYSVMDHPLAARLFKYAEGGEATGAQLQDLASKLGKAARSQMSGNGDRQLGMALFEVKNLADDLLEQGLKGKTKQLFSQARSQYRNAMMIESRVGVLNPSNGNVSGGTLANVLQQQDKAGFLRGGNTSPMYDAARLAQAFKPIVGDSGTATRSALPSPTDFVLSLPFNLATRAYTSNPVIKLAARGGDISRNGLLQNLDPKNLKYLPQIGAATGIGVGGLLAFPQ